MRLAFFSGFLTTRKLIIILAWYAIFMVIAIFTYSHTRWKEESNLLRVYNSLFLVPSDVPLLRDSTPTRLSRLSFRENGTNAWNGSGVWLPFDPETGELRYRYSTRTYPQRTNRLEVLKQSLLHRIGNSSVSSLVLIRNISNGRLLSETFDKDLWRRNAQSRTSNDSLAGVLEQLVGRDVGDFFEGGEQDSYNSSMLLAAIEKNMQKIRKETEISLKQLSHLSGILNGTSAAGNTTNPKEDGRLALNYLQAKDGRYLQEPKTWANQKREEARRYHLINGENDKTRQDLAMEGNPQTHPGGPPTFKKGKSPSSKNKSDRPSLLSVLIGQDLFAEEKKPKLASRGSVIRELTKDTLKDRNMSSTPLSTETPEVDGYYRIDTRKKLRLQCSSCAVISSSGQLLNTSAGSHIDSYPCVLRMNSAPTSGYEKDVGSKTTIRVMGHVNLLKVNSSETEQAEIFINRTTRTEMLVIPWLYTTRINKRRDKHYNIAKNFSKIYPDTEFYVLSSGKMISAESIFQRETGITRKDAKTWLSTGWMTILFALDVCRKIDVFGLVPENYCKLHPNDTTPYHYYDKEFKSECTYYKESEEHLNFGHLFVTEKAIFARWALKYNIDFLHPQWNLTASNMTGPLDTPFLKLFHEAQHNKTTKQRAMGGRGHRSFLGTRIRPRKPAPVGPKTKEEAEKERYQKLTHAIMFIVAIFLSLVVFLLLFLLASLFVFCFYL